MVRRRRLFIPGLPQHVIQRGNNRSDMFRAPDDYERFLVALHDGSQRHRLDVHAYTLMTNHVHLIVTPHEPRAIAHVMQVIGARYVSDFNQRYGRTGTLFEGRYRSSVIDTERYYLRCLRYVEMNPVRAKLVDDPKDYRWSSYAAHAFGSPDPVLTMHPMYLQLGPTPRARQASWRVICAVVDNPDDLSEIREAVHRGEALGTVWLPNREDDAAGDPEE